MEFTIPFYHMKISKPKYFIYLYLLSNYLFYQSSSLIRIICGFIGELTTSPRYYSKF